MPIPNKLIDQLLEGNTAPEDLLGEHGLLNELIKRVAERALEAEMDHHLGYSKHETKGHRTGNSRNGKSRKSVRSVHGEIDLDVPRDRNSEFEPGLIKKGEKQLNGFDDRIISLYSRGMTTRDIQAHFVEAYGVEVCATFISQMANAVMEEVRAWQSRPLDSVYPAVYLDALVVRSRASGTVQNNAVHLTARRIPGLRIAQNEGAKFWLSVMTELKNRGVQDIFIACTDGLKGFPEAIEAVYPQTQVQLCIVHQDHKKVDHAYTGLETGHEAVYDHVW